MFCFSNQYVTFPNTDYIRTFCFGTVSKPKRLFRGPAGHISGRRSRKTPHALLSAAAIPLHYESGTAFAYFADNDYLCKLQPLGGRTTQTRLRDSVRLRPYA